MAGFVAGLVCGEGNFTIAVSRQSNCRLGVHARALFQLEMSRVDERLLISVSEFFGFGYLNYPRPRTRVARESPTCKYLVTDINGCMSLIDFFTENPLIGAKQESFEKWAKCVRVIRSGRHTSDDGMREILRLRDGMNPFRRPSSYVQPAAHEALLRPTGGRVIHPWSDHELDIARQYLAGQITRKSLGDQLDRTTASVAAQLTRMRRA